MSEGDEDKIVGELLEGRVWVVIEGSVATFGLTESGVEELGVLEGLHLPEEGEIYDKDDSLFVVEGTMSAIEFLIPCSGVISEINELIADEPDALSDDPGDEGWLVRVECNNPQEIIDEF